MAAQTSCSCRLSFAAVLLTISALGPPVQADPPRSLDVAGHITQVLTLQQKWSDEEARRFYNVPQGSKLVRYEWFLHLEQPDSEKLFRDASHIRRLGYLPRTPDAAGNPDGLPIGFTEDGEHLGFTCAACHTAQINLGSRAWLVDGAPGQGDFETLLRRLVAALAATADAPDKFDRFAARVLGGAATDADKARLKADLQAALKVRKGYNLRNLPSDTGTPYGPGRVDAFGAIMNEVAATIAGVPGNHAPADAPVSYPFLWDTPQHDFVQWNGAAENRKTSSKVLQRLVGTEHIGALGRNSGEVLGVFGTMDASAEGSLLSLRSYPSSINRPNLIAVEDSLRKLWSPTWPAEFPPIQADLRDKGKALFQENCAACHAPIRRDDEARTVRAHMAAVGTDPLMATNFMTRTAKTGVLKGRLIELLSFPPRLFGETAQVGLMLRHVVQRGILRPNVAQLLASVDDEPVDTGRLLSELESGFDLKVAGVAKGSLNKLATRYSFQAAGAKRTTFDVAYKGRPLNGIWATAPYLHNGSVPNLDELLKPPAERSQEVFRVGSQEFDPVKVGYVTDRGAEFDPTRRGNSNAGHDFSRRANGQPFTDEERKQLIEYMKSL